MSARPFQRAHLRRLGDVALFVGCAGALAAGAWIAWSELWIPRPESIVVDVAGNTVRLLSPLALTLLLVLPALPLIQRFTLTDFPWYQRGLNLLLRAGFWTAIVLALARPSTTTWESKVCSVYLVDVSASVPDASLAEARGVVQAAWDGRGPDDVLRLITFAGRPRAVTLHPGMIDVPALERHETDQETTNAAAALRLSYGLCPQDHVRRAVLVTDGNENRGDLIAEAARAADFGVTVHAHEIGYEVPAEVSIRALDLPQEIEVGAPFTIIAEIFASDAGSARIDLTQNEFRDIRGQAVSLEPGINRIELRAEVYEPGFRTFTLSVRPEGSDRFEENNRFTRSVVVEGRPRVLYVEGESRSRGYLQRALDADRNDLANFDLEVRGAYGVPNRVEEMVNYDLIILSDVDARYVSRSAMAAFERYVRVHGGGLLLAGGERSFGPGGFDDTPLESISPVYFDMQRQRDLPSLSIQLVIDRSGSMSGQKLEMAKDAAKAVVEMLGPQDHVGVIAFDDVPEAAVRLQPASNRSRIRAEIGRIQSGGGTAIFPALEQAYFDLLDHTSRLEHVILLTDGQAPWEGIAELVSSMRTDGITVSSVAVGGEADRSLCELIAELGGGRFYATNDPNNIPQIFIQETSQVARTNLIEEPFRPQVARRSQALRGIDWGSVPYLLGYVSTRAKRGAEVLLETERGEPLLARWRQGLGRVAVFTSDVKNRWSVEWVRSRVYPQFWAQVIRDMMRVDTEEELAMRARVDDGRGRIIVDAIDDDDRFVNGLTSNVEVTEPDGTRRQVDLRQVAAGRYEGEFELSEFGSYLMRADHERDGDTVATSYGSLTWPYPDEYLAIDPDRELGRRAAAATGGRVDPSVVELWDPGDARSETPRALWPYLVYAALFFFVLDLLARRIRLDRGKPTRWGDLLAR